MVYGGEVRREKFDLLLEAPGSGFRELVEAEESELKVVERFDKRVVMGSDVWGGA